MLSIKLMLAFCGIGSAMQAPMFSGTGLDADLGWLHMLAQAGRERSVDASEMATAGMTFSFRSESNESSYLGMSYDKGCVQLEDEFHGVVCNFKWGDSLKSLGTLFLTKPLEEGSTIDVVSSFKFLGALNQALLGTALKDVLRPVSFKCAVCGEECSPPKGGIITKELMGIGQETRTCPIEAGKELPFDNCETSLPPAIETALIPTLENTVTKTFRHSDGSIALIGTFTFSIVQSFDGEGSGGSWDRIFKKRKPFKGFKGVPRVL